MVKKRVVIIGAGIAGLSAATFLARNGYDTEIFEMHTLPGGLCTAWKRKGYTVDYCVHWLLGTRPGTAYHRIWKELGAFTNADGSATEIRNFESFTSIGFPNGEHLNLYSDASQLEAEMLRIAPEDATRIRSFCRHLRRLSGIDLPVTTERWTVLHWMGYVIKNIGKLGSMMGLLRTPLGRFAGRWQNEKMRQAFTAGIPGEWSLASLAFGMALQHSKSAGYPVGGSLVLSRNIERNYLALGGRIHYSAQVQSIIVENNRAVGIRLLSGEEIRGDYVVSAADGHETLFEMLCGQYLTPRLRHAYDRYPLFPSSIFVGLGINRDLSNLPHASLLYLEKPMDLPDGTKLERFSVTIYNFDPTLAPAGKTLVTVLINTWNGDYWHDLAIRDLSNYEQKKNEIADNVIDNLEAAFGDIKKQIEVVDVSTPHTVMRYTGNWHGSYEGFAPTPENFSVGLPKTLPGLEAFWMIGQWTTPGGGLPTAAKDGRDLAVKLCRRDGKKFSGDRV